MAQFVHVAYYDSSTALAAATDAFPNIKQHLGNLREFFKTLPNTTLMVSPHTNLRLINDVLVATTKVNSDSHVLYGKHLSSSPIISNEEGTLT